MTIARIAEQIQPLLELPYIRKTRRNHGLEHATIHILSGRVANLRMAGRSNAQGFVLLGEAGTAQIEAAAREALRRMQRGEHDLAVHPNCGTNLVTTALMASAAALFAMTGADRRSLWDRLPAIFSLVLVVLLFSPGVGLSLQRHITTDGDPGEMAIESITRREVRLPWSSDPLIVHHVRTIGG
jgi:hypothetical protein